MDQIFLGNRYELHEEIGSGGMAHVFKARDTLLDRIVAIKILKPEYTEDTQLIERFRVEAKAAASLSNSNIVMIYDVGQDDGIYYIIMEYIDGITLKKYIANTGRIPWKEAVTIAVQMSQAIESAHLNHIIHRDIKPQNVLLTKDRKIKITDFGIARAASTTTITTVGNAMGSVHYFSPEQAKGSLADEKSDIYSFGITLYEMVTGTVPFEGETPISVALKHIQEQPSSPTLLVPQIPLGLSAIILKSIAKDKYDRYQSMGEILTDLKKVLKDPSGDTLQYASVYKSEMQEWGGANSSGGGFAGAGQGGYQNSAGFTSVGFAGGGGRPDSSRRPNAGGFARDADYGGEAYQPDAYAPDRHNSPAYEQRPYDERGQFADRGQYGERGAYAERGQYADRGPHAERGPYGERGAYADRGAYDERGAYQQRPYDANAATGDGYAADAYAGGDGYADDRYAGGRYAGDYDGQDDYGDGRYADGDYDGEAYAGGALVPVDGAGGKKLSRRDRKNRAMDGYQSPDGADGRIARVDSRQNARNKRGGATYGESRGGGRDPDRGGRRDGGGGGGGGGGRRGGGGRDDRDDRDGGRRGGGYTGVFVVVVLVAVLAAIAFIVWMMNNLFGIIKTPILANNEADDNFAVENYIGRRYDDVSEELRKAGIKTKENRTPNDRVAEGLIMEQSHEAGYILKRNGPDVIVFEVSDGEKRFTVPDYREYETDSRAAEAELAANGLDVYIIDEQSGAVPKGYVIRTDPGAGSHLSSGTKITIYRSLGSETVQTTVPQLIGKTYRDALTLLNEAKLAPGSIKPETIQNTAVVIWQSIEPNSLVDEGVAIDMEFEEAEPTTEEATIETTTTSETEETTEETTENPADATPVPTITPEPDAPEASPEPSGEATTAEQTTRTPRPDDETTTERATPESSDPVILTVSLKLPPDIPYGENIKVLVEATPSDTGRTTRLLNRSVKRDDFPRLLDVTIPPQGSVELKVYYDGVLMQTHVFNYDD